MQPLPLFTPDRLPRKPYCSERPGADLIRTLPHALKFPYMQVNGPALKYWLLFDNDYEGSAFAWEEAGIAEPNFTIVNLRNGHCHMMYGLLTPLVTSPNGRIAPLRYAGAIEAGYSARLRSDPSYGQLITKNPTHPRWRTIVGPQWAYDLGELASYLPDIKKLSDKRRRHVVGVGRNVTLYDRIRYWAYRNINKTAWVSVQAWHDAAYVRASHYNDFPAPLRDSEVRATSKSVAKWVWQHLRGAQADYIERSHTSEIQAARGRKSGKIRSQRAHSEAAKAYEMVSQGKSQKEIARSLGVNRTTVYRWIKNCDVART